MQTNNVTRLDKKPFLRINERLRTELRPLTETELSELRKGIKRDGVLSPVAYWVNPQNGQAEIVDGHNRHAIAQELGIGYEAVEIQFASIECVMYWMHRTNAGRRDGKADTKRMTELLAIITRQNGERMTKTEIVKTVAEDTGTPERTVWDRESKKDEKEKATPLDRILKLIAKLSDDDRRKLKDIL